MHVSNFQIAGTHNTQDNMLRREYEAMRKEAEWAEALKPTRLDVVLHKHQS